MVNTEIKRAEFYFPNGDKAVFKLGELGDYFYNSEYKRYPIYLIQVKEGHLDIYVECTNHPFSFYGTFVTKEESIK